MDGHETPLRRITEPTPARKQLLDPLGSASLDNYNPTQIMHVIILY